MAIKKKSVKNSPPKPVKSHFLWSIFFLVFALVSFLFLILVYLVVGYSIFWPALASIMAIIGIILIKRERSTGKLGRGKWLWSIFFVAVTMGSAIYMAQVATTTVSILAAGAATIALILLIREKYLY